MLRNLILTIWCWYANWRASENTAYAGCFLITTMPNDWHEYHWFSGPGWYYADECEQLVGPFDSLALALDAREYYIAYVL